MSKALKLLAMDADDLNVISAHVQDAVLKSADMDYAPAAASIALPVNRFVWEAPRSRLRFLSKHERRKSVLQFGRVLGVSSQGIDRADGDQVLSLLAMTFEQNTEGDPSGTVTLLFSGNATLRLAVECLEVRLADLDARWETARRPRHAV